MADRNPITSIVIDDNVLVIKTTNGIEHRFRDEAQFCCESRFMTCDDDLQHFIGSEYIEWELKDCQSNNCADSHDIQTLEIKTSYGSFNVFNHNVHNGYYGGFHISYDQK